MEDYLSKTPQGYTYLPVKRNHMLNWGGLAVCDYCNADMEQGYLVYILNSCICPDCFNDWVKRAQTYTEDLNMQDEYQDEWYCHHINFGHVELDVKRS